MPFATSGFIITPKLGVRETGSSPGSDFTVATSKRAGHALDMSIKIDKSDALSSLKNAGFEVSKSRDGAMVLKHGKSGISATMYTRTSNKELGLDFQYNGETIAKVTLLSPE